MELVELQRAELGDQLAALRGELETWRERAKPNQTFEKHHTQVERITRQLESYLDGLGEPEEHGGLGFAELRALQSHLLLAHRIWAYFRSKLALRDVTWLRDPLRMADELAWECYRPARDKAEAAGMIAPGSMKEPPLVFFTSEASPFVQARATHFVPEGVTGDDFRRLDDFRRFDDALLLLPIPVLGIPWFQIDHLPAAVVIGHEAGHAVDRDYGVVESLASAYDALDFGDGRLAGWQAWRNEIFADVYGVLCTGPASIRALMAYLAAEPEAIRRERLPHPRTGWGAYPTKHLRMQLNFAALREIGLDEAAAELEAAWLAAYPSHLMKTYEEDIAKVVRLLLQTPLAVFGGKPLTAVISFTREDLARAKLLAGKIKRGSQLGQNERLRHLFAAATLAYYDAPGQYRQHAGRAGLLAQLIAAIPGGVRGRVAVVSDAAQQEADKAQGLALLQLAREQEARRSVEDADGRTGTGDADSSAEQ
ncbi:MAG: hypothetical protein RRC07_12665 [Anaerolineae bacterium]|nr:hypothetical protein [Anaerolineae bacterium]